MFSRAETDKKQTRILVVEDEGIIARDITTMLEQLGYEVTGQAGNGADAIELASILATDLVLMDIKIRGPLDGVETADQIRRKLGVPVVFLTAHADSDTLKRANATEPFGYIVKPFSESDLKVAVEVGLNRHRLQEQSEEKQTWFRSALESIHEAVMATDGEGRITFFNTAAEQLTGWSSSEAVGRSLPEVLQLLDSGNQVNLLDLSRFMTTDEPISFGDAKLRHKDGSHSAVIGSFGPMRKPGARAIHGFVVMVRDFTNIQGLDRPSEDTDSLPSSDQQLQELSYALSNDLREPVRNISCFAELLERKGAMLLDQAGREYLEFIVAGSKRIESQMGALRSFHLAGRVDPDSNLWADATEICNQAMRALESLIRETGAQISLGPLPTVAMAPAAFLEIAQNLLSNAIRFRADRVPCIQVSAVRSGSFWKFSFEDNGLGFDRQQSERIFSLFTKAHEPQRCGNGVGLAICRRLIETAGGRIWAESQVGEGSTFHFTVPALILRDAAA